LILVSKPGCDPNSEDIGIKKDEFPQDSSWTAGHHFKAQTLIEG
jgi:hypothetical protein